MGKPKSERFIEKEVRQEEDDIYNYDNPKASGVNPTIVLIIVLVAIVISFGAGTLVMQNNKRQSQAEESIKQAQQVVEQTAANQTQIIQGQSSSNSTSNTAGNNVEQVFVKGYNEEITADVYSVLNSLFVGIGGTSFDLLLNDACQNGMIETLAKVIAEENSTANSYSFISCNISATFDYEMLQYGLSNAVATQTDVIAYWAGAVATDEGYSIYMLFEKN